MLTREGKRLDRRNGQDTFVALYNHQIPPGAAAVVHYLLEVPEDVSGPITIEAALRYRKFDTTYLRQVQGEIDPANCLRVDLHCHDHNSDVPDELWGRLLRLPETWLKTKKLKKIQKMQLKPLKNR